MLEDAVALDKEWEHLPVAPLKSVSAGVQSRTRALLVIPIVMAVLITIFIAVSFCISECPCEGRGGGLRDAEPALPKPHPFFFSLEKVVKEPEDNKVSWKE